MNRLTIRADAAESDVDRMFEMLRSDVDRLVESGVDLDQVVQYTAVVAYSLVVLWLLSCAVSGVFSFVVSPIEDPCGIVM